MALTPQKVDTEYKNQSIVSMYNRGLSLWGKNLFEIGKIALCKTVSLENPKKLDS